MLIESCSIESQNVFATIGLMRQSERREFLLYKMNKLSPLNLTEVRINDGESAIEMFWAENFGGSAKDINWDKPKGVEWAKINGKREAFFPSKTSSFGNLEVIVSQYFSSMSGKCLIGTNDWTDTAKNFHGFVQTLSVKMQTNLKRFTLLSRASHAVYLNFGKKYKT